MENTTNNNMENNSSGKNAEERRKGGLGKLGGVFGSIRNSTKSEGDLNKDLHKLTRTELLEMLIDETKEADRLRLENRRLKKELARCREDLDKTASLDIVIRRLEEIADRAGR